MITVSMGINWGLEMQDLESYHMLVHLQDSTELKLLILSRLPPPTRLRNPDQEKGLRQCE